MTSYSNNGDLNGSGPFYVRFQINSGYQNVVSNYTDFSWWVWVGCSSTGWGTFGANGSWGVNLAGVGYSGAIPTLDFRPAGSSNREILVAAGTTSVGHNPDGTRPGFPNYASIDTDHSSVGDGSVTTWADAPTIPRASTASYSPAPCEFNQLMTISITRASTGFTHDVSYSFGTASGTIATNVATSATWTPPLSLLNQIPNSASGTGNIIINTYSGTTLIGSTSTSFTLVAPASIAPDFTTITNAEATAGVAANVGRYVQNISKLALAITGAVSSGYGSTIASYKIEVAGQTINAVSGTTLVALATSGTYNITGTVTDSRGRTKVKNVSITVLPYAPPTINSVSVQRANSSNVLQDDGTYLRVNINASVQSLVNSTERNALVYKLSTRVRNTPPWVVKATTTPGGVTFNSNTLIGTAYSATLSYDLLVEIIDDFTTTAIQIIVPTATFFMHWKGTEGVGFGKVRERGRIDARGDIFFNRGVEDWRAVTNVGTTAERDAVYPLPANDTDRVALANKMVTWFNTTLSRWEIYYALGSLSGLVVPGLATGFASGWYSMPSGEWAGKSGPATYVSAYKVAWSRGINGAGTTLDAVSDANGIKIGMSGIYECHSYLRGGAGGNAYYTAMGLNGDRVAFEERSNTTPGAMVGLWTHDHPAAANNFSVSHYLGQLYAGDLITAGPYTSGTDISLGSAASSGMLSIRRIA